MLFTANAPAATRWHTLDKTKAVLDEDDCLTGEPQCLLVNKGTMVEVNVQDLLPEETYLLWKVKSKDACRGMRITEMNEKPCGCEEACDCECGEQIEINCETCNLVINGGEPDCDYGTYLLIYDGTAMGDGKIQYRAVEC